jgi:hypothetical protein
VAPGHRRWLSQRIRRFRDLLIALAAGRQRKVAALIGDDRLGAFDGPLREIAAVRDRHRLGDLIHDVRFRLIQYDCCQFALL